MSLYRSRTDCCLFGLCGGIARSTGVDSTWVRLGLIIGGFVTGGMLFVIYILSSMVVPKEPAYAASTYGSWQSASPSYGFTPHTAANTQPSPSVNALEVDSMMKDLEQKALAREIQALRSKLSKYENKSEGAN